MTRIFAARPRPIVPALLSAAALLAACHRQQPPPPAAETQPAQKPLSIELGKYRAVLATPGGDLPFFISLVRENDQVAAYLINGPELLPIHEVTLTGSHLEIMMPGYENKITADAAGDTLSGELALSKLNGNDQHIPLTAKLGANYRFFPVAPAGDEAPNNINVNGRWAATFTDSDNTSEKDVGEFAQDGDVVTGTILTPTGDHRYLAGQVRGNELYLSTFDGAHAFLYKATLGADGTLKGDFWSGLKSHETFVAKRDANAHLVDPYAYTKMKRGEKHFAFAFPDLNGNTVTNNDPKFRGKVLIVALAGSWCPNCHDEAAFLEPLYRDYRDRGVEVVSLMFEHFGDFPRAAAATQRFRQQYSIDYTTLIAGVSDKDEAGKKLPMLSKFLAFPTTVFIDKKGNVRKIHTGFTGPATGGHYTEFVNETKAELDKLVAEKG
ncbi:MAG TPA: TlpA disulfide reductase family protein [Steroidobacteraceae bacterium]|jgi:peroxiredoxin